MPCNSSLKQGQTISQRGEEIRTLVQQIDTLLAQRKIAVRVGRQGAVVFVGLSDTDRDGMTDNCIYRMLTRTGSAAAKIALARAEQLAGRAVDRKVIAAGVHSHDGGVTWSGRG